MKRTLEEKIAWAIKYLDSPNLSMSDIAQMFKVSKKTVQNAMSQFTLVNCQQSVENKHMIVASGIDITKISAKDLTGSPAATKAALEKQGYACTLK